MILLRAFEFVVKEYISIVEHLIISEPIENDRIVLDRETFSKLLEQYDYMTFSAKTKIYKQLNFIIHDKNNYTIPYKDKELKKTVRKVIINYTTYETVKHLFENDIAI